MKPIALQLYTVRELTQTPADFRRVLAEVAEAGYLGIETGGISDMKPREFARFVEELGMVVCSYWAMPTRENLAELVDLAGALRIRQFVNCVSEEQFRSVDDARRAAEQFEAAAGLLKPHGLEMCYHNHWYEFAWQDGGRYGWDILFEHAPSVKCELDLYWASNFGRVDVPAVMQRYAARTPLIHVKDGPLVNDQPNTAVGAGMLNLTDCLAAYDPKVTQWLIVELDACVGGAEQMMAAVRESYGYLTRHGLAQGRK